MKFYLSLAFVAFFLAFGIYFVSGRLRSNSVSGEGFFISSIQQDKKEKAQSSNAEITKRVLTENCGQCHQSSRTTANPKALAIFDLDKNPWYTPVSDKHLEGISRRISSKSGVSDSDRTAVQEFIKSIRKGNSKDGN